MVVAIMVHPRRHRHGGDAERHQRGQGPVRRPAGRGLPQAAPRAGDQPAPQHRDRLHRAEPLTSIQRAASDPPNPLGPSTPLESTYLEGRLEFRQFAGVPDTPDAFGNAAAVVVGGANPVMFTSEGSFTDVDGNPINASIFLGVPNQASTANALTIIGTTATVRTFRWDGSRWVQ